MNKSQYYLKEERLITPARDRVFVVYGPGKQMITGKTIIKPLLKSSDKEIANDFLKSRQDKEAKNDNVGV